MIFLPMDITPPVMYNLVMKFLIMPLSLFVVLVFAVPLAAAPALEYPDIYAKELPRYPGAEIVDAGRSVKSLKDGIRLKLITPDPVQKVVKYYEDTLKAKGWKIPSQRFANDKVHVGTYSRGNYKFSLTVIRYDPSEGKTSIQLIYLER